MFHEDIGHFLLIKLQILLDRESLLNILSPAMQ